LKLRYRYQQEDADTIDALGEQKDCFISKPIDNEEIIGRINAKLMQN
jgi:DNA-binding response OmpR family regulator